MIKILGTLKKVDIKSQAGDNGSEVHYITMKFELAQGQNRMQEVVELLKEIVEVTLDSRQPSLPTHD